LANLINSIHKFEEFGVKMMINWQSQASVLIINSINKIIIEGKKKELKLFNFFCK